MALTPNPILVKHKNCRALLGAMFNGVKSSDCQIHGSEIKLKILKSASENLAHFNGSLSIVNSPVVT